MDFDEARQQSHRTWNSYLGRIRVETPKRDDKVKFYTGLYHALLGRGLASDVNGAYPGNNGSVGQIPLDRRGRTLYNPYNTDAIWGAFWNLTKCWSLAYPAFHSDFIKTQLLFSKEAGSLGERIAHT